MNMLFIFHYPKKNHPFFLFVDFQAEMFFFFLQHVTNLTERTASLHAVHSVSINRVINLTVPV